MSNQTNRNSLASGRQITLGRNRNSYCSRFDVRFRGESIPFFIKPKLKIVFEPEKERSEFISEYLDRRWNKILKGNVKNVNGELTPVEDYPLRHFINVTVENKGSVAATNCEPKLKLIHRINNCLASSTHEKKLVWENGEEKLTLAAKHGREKFQIAFSQEKLTAEQKSMISPIHCGIVNQETYFRSWFTTRRALESIEYADADGLCLGNFMVHVEVATEDGYRVFSDFLIKVGEGWRNLDAEQIKCECFQHSKRRRFINHIFRRGSKPRK